MLSLYSFFSVVMAVMMYFMPESPFYLVSQGKVKEAEKSLQFLRRSDEVQTFLRANPTKLVLFVIPFLSSFSA
jgi:hypothetical protein